MSWPEITSPRSTPATARAQAPAQFDERDEAVDLLTLAAVCQEHLLLIGPPGTAKTELVRRFTELIDAQRFHYLLTRFTEPSELFGPLDLAAFHDRRFHIRTDGMLPTAEIAFLDEVFQGSSAILNTLLTLVNERVFYNGATPQPVPLISLIGASNDLPDDPVLRAFADRFPLRVQVEPVADDGLSTCSTRAGSSSAPDRDSRTRRWPGAGHQGDPPTSRRRTSTSSTRDWLEVEAERIRRCMPRRCASSAPRGSSSPTGGSSRA